MVVPNPRAAWLWPRVSQALAGTTGVVSEVGREALFLDFSVPADSHFVSVVIMINNSNTPRARLPVPL